ncbi:MAG: hypothetical protein ACR2NG_04580 [Acidimicrobiia bacterium]
MTDNESGAAPVPNEEEKDDQLLFGASDRIELISTIALAIATILTAWSAFQAGKWSGTQAINFSEAGAARTESTRADTRAGQLTQIDVAMYIDWVTAISTDLNTGAIALDDVTAYEPTKGTVSGFLYNRFRPEFAPAVDAWLATDPIANPDAPPTPFAMVDENGDPIVTNELAEEANRLTAVADAKAAAGRTANQNGDNYVLTMVLFASVLFFAGVSSKLVKKRNRMLALGFGVVLLAIGGIILISLPIHPI